MDQLLQRGHTRPKPAAGDPWLSPREAAELVLGHAHYPRDKRVIRNMTKRITKACCIHENTKLDKEYRVYFGLVCPPPLPNGRREILLSEVLRWTNRLRIRGVEPLPSWQAQGGNKTPA